MIKIFNKFRLDSEKINKAQQKFFIIFTPKWFDFLEWLIIMGALDYVLIKVQSGRIFVGTLLVISLLCTSLFIWSLLANSFFLERYFRFFRKSEKKWLGFLVAMFHVLLALVLTIFISKLVYEIVRALALSQIGQ